MSNVLELLCFEIEFPGTPREIGCGTAVKLGRSDYL
jgi:hypothetical protein